jgi:GNAT superfamily N-acetyltransferase
MKPIIRLITENDFGVAERILQSAFAITESRLDDIRRYHALQSESYFLALIDGEPAGMAGAVNYGLFAFVGMMAVDPRFQRQGLGYTLMEHLLQRIETWGVPLTSLDASEAGAKLYPRFGFLDFDKVLMFQLADHSQTYSIADRVRLLELQDLDALAEFDQPIFGGDRRRMLQVLLHDFPGRAFGIYDKTGRIKGFVFAQPARLGPWVALNQEDAELLLRAALTLYPDAPSVIIPETNGIGLELLKRYGFTLKLVNRHMYLGRLPLPSRRAFFYGQTSFGLG